jgi:hypothetical protein
MREKVLSFWVNFLAFFQQIPSNFAFYDTHIEFLPINILWVLLALFAHFEGKFGRNGSKTKNVPYFINVSLNSILHPVDSTATAREFSLSVWYRHKVANFKNLLLGTFFIYLFIY